MVGRARPTLSRPLEPDIAGSRFVGLDIAVVDPSSESVDDPHRVRAAPPEAAHQQCTDAEPHRRQEKGEPDGVGDEAGRDEQDPGREDQEAVDQLAMGHPTLGDRALQAPEHGDALALDQPDPDDRDGDEKPDGLEHADGGGNLHDHPQLSDEEHHQEGEHP